MCFFIIIIQHTIVVDKRDNMVLPTEGYFLKLSQVCLSLSSVLKNVVTKMEISQSMQMTVWRKLFSVMLGSVQGVSLSRNTM